MEAQDGNFNRNLLPAIRALNGSREAIALSISSASFCRPCLADEPDRVNEAIENLSTRLSHNGELLSRGGGHGAEPRVVGSVLLRPSDCGRARSEAALGPDRGAGLSSQA